MKAKQMLDRHIIKVVQYSSMVWYDVIYKNKCDPFKPCSMFEIFLLIHTLYNYESHRKTWLLCHQGNHVTKTCK